MVPRFPLLQVMKNVVHINGMEFFHYNEKVVYGYSRVEGMH